MTHAINVLSAAIKYVPTSLCNSQLAAIEDFCAIFANWITVEYSPTVPSAAVPNPLKTIVSLPKPSPIHYPAPTYKGDHFQGCLQTIDTSNSQGAESGSKLQGLLVTNSLSYKITSCSSPQYSPFWGTTPAFRWTHYRADEILHSVAKFHYYITLMGFVGTNSDACSILCIIQWHRKTSKLWTTDKASKV